MFKRYGADNFREILRPAYGIALYIAVEHLNGKDLDAIVTIEGSFSLEGSKRNEFAQKLGDLIEKYRV